MPSATSKKIRLSGSPKANLCRTHSLKLFYNDIRQYEPLSQEDILLLFKQYHEGTKQEKEKAFNKLCQHNLKLVISLARDYCSNDDNLNDLIQEGNIGLMKSIEMYDVNNGTPFVAYSMYWIRRYINIFKTNVTPIVAQTNRSKTANVIANITNELWQKHERIPTPEEILDTYNTKYPDKYLSNTDDIIDIKYVFIDQMNPDDEFGHDFQALSAYNNVSMSHNTVLEQIEHKYKKRIVEELTQGLTEKEMQAITMLFGLDGNMEESINTVSVKMGITTQRVSQLYLAAIKKMKQKYQKLSFKS